MSGYIVESVEGGTWSGPNAGDPDNPALGRECVFSRKEAHVFKDYIEAAREAATYNHPGAIVMEEGHEDMLRIWLQG